MAFLCTATFGLFCLAVQTSKVEIELHRERGEGHFYNIVNLKAPNWRATYLYTDRPGMDPPELIPSFLPKDSKAVCDDGQCVRYHAFCNVLPEGFKSDVGRISCLIGFEVGEYLPGQRFEETIMVYADAKSGVEEAMWSLGFLRPRDSKMVMQANGSSSAAEQPGPDRRMIVPFSALTLTMRDVGKRQN